jgi:peptide/nickel transport system substrate-binding protein
MAGFARRHVSRRGALVIGGSAAFLAACGSGDNNKGNDQGKAAVTSTAAGGQGQAQGQPKTGGEFVFSDIGDTPLDPTNNPTYRAQTLAGFTYSRLLMFKTGPQPDVAFYYEVIPDLAASHELSGDGTRLTFKLQPNAKFINVPPVNGRDVTSEDVKASFDRFRTAPKNTNKSAFGSDTNRIVDAIETPDPKTVVVKLARPYAPILNLFANPQYLWIQPKEIGSGFDPDKQQIGSGPWMLGDVKPDQKLTLTRNPNWYFTGKPYIETVTRAVIPETAQAIAQFQSGRLSTYGVPAEQKDDVQRSTPQAVVLTYIPTTYTFISPQQREGSPFRDVRVRQALSLAIDRDAWGKLLYQGQGIHYLDAVPASMGKWWLDPKGSSAGAGSEWFKHDPAKARELLKAAGQEGMSLRFIYANNAYGDTFNSGAEATASMLKDAGFNVQFVAQDYLKDYIQAKGTFFGNYDGVFYGLQTPFTDPHDYIFSMNHPKSARNHAGIDDPKLTAMIDDEEKTFDEAARVKKVQDIQRYWIENVYYVPLAVGSAYSFRQPYLKNYNYSSTYGFAAEALAAAWDDRA